MLIRSSLSGLLGARRLLVQPTRTIATRPIPLHTRLPSLRRHYAAAGLSREKISERVLEVIKGFEKIDPDKVLPWHVSTKCSEE